MNWKIVEVDQSTRRDAKPFISISYHRINFGVNFARVADIDDSYRVTIYVDEDDFRLAFEFHKEEKPNSLALVADNKKAHSGKRTGLFCSSRGLQKNHPWVVPITKLPVGDRRFYPEHESKKWVISLCPSFETRYARESVNISPDASGIYQYKNEEGEIVYIGRGNISQRLRSPEREDWNFHIVECSLIKDPDLQIKWESHWIESFRTKYGRLPYYNKVSGASID